MGRSCRRKIPRLLDGVARQTRIARGGSFAKKSRRVVSRRDRAHRWGNHAWWAPRIRRCLYPL